MSVIEVVAAKLKPKFKYRLMFLPKAYIAPHPPSRREDPSSHGGAWGFGGSKPRRFCLDYYTNSSQLRVEAVVSRACDASSHIRR